MEIISSICSANGIVDPGTVDLLVAVVVVVVVDVPVDVVVAVVVVTVVGLRNIFVFCSGREAISSSLVVVVAVGCSVVVVVVVG